MTSAAFRHHQTLINSSLTVFFAFTGILIGFAYQQPTGSKQQYAAIALGSVFSAVWLFRSLRWRAYNKSYLVRLKKIEEDSNGNGLFLKDAVLNRQNLILRIPFSGIIPTTYAVSALLYIVATVIVINTK